ncbi:MAG: NAD(P)-binding protein [Acidimicrobiia bacterium]
MSERVEVAVVGGGLGGLFTGVELARRGIEAVVLEAADVPGGITRTIDVDGYAIEPAAGAVTLPHPHLGPILAAAGVSLHPAVGKVHRWPACCGGAGGAAGGQRAAPHAAVAVGHGHQVWERRPRREPLRVARVDARRHQARHHRPRLDAEAPAQEPGQGLVAGGRRRAHQGLGHCPPLRPPPDQRSQQTRR